MAQKHFPSIANRRCFSSNQGHLARELSARIALKSLLFQFSLHFFTFFHFVQGWQLSHQFSLRFCAIFRALSSFWHPRVTTLERSLWFWPFREQIRERADLKHELDRDGQSFDENHFSHIFHGRRETHQKPTQQKIKVWFKQYSFQVILMFISEGTGFSHR